MRSPPPSLSLNDSKMEYFYLMPPSRYLFSCSLLIVYSFGYAWPRVGGSGGDGPVAAAVAARSGGSSASAVGNPPNGVWRSGMGDHGPANSEKDHDYDDDDSDGDYDEEEAGNYHGIGAGVIARSTHVAGMMRVGGDSRN